MDGVQLPQGYTEPLQEDSLLFTRNFLYSLDQYRKDERLRWPWGNPVVFSLCINLVIFKYKLMSQFKLTQLWPLIGNCFKVSSQSYLSGLSKTCFLRTDQFCVTTSSSFWTLLKMYTWGQKDSFGTKFKKILSKIFFEKCSAERVLLSCCIRYCPYSMQ